MPTSLTPPNLVPVTSVASGDLLVVWPSTAGGPLSKITFANFTTALLPALNTGYLQSANNLSDLANATTARGYLGLGTAAVANIGTSGNTVPLCNGANTFSVQQTLLVSNSGGQALPLSLVNGGAWAANSAVAQYFSPTSGVAAVIKSTAAASATDADLAFFTATGGSEIEALQLMPNGQARLYGQSVSGGNGIPLILANNVGWAANSAVEQYLCPTANTTLGAVLKSSASARANDADLQLWTCNGGVFVETLAFSPSGVPTFSSGPIGLSQGVSGGALTVLSGKNTAAYATGASADIDLWPAPAATSIVRASAASANSSDLEFWTMNGGSFVQAMTLAPSGAATHLQPVTIQQPIANAGAYPLTVQNTAADAAGNEAGVLLQPSATASPAFVNGYRDTGPTYTGIHLFYNQGGTPRVGLQITSGGALALPAYGAGVLTADASGNVSAQAPDLVAEFRCETATNTGSPESWAASTWVTRVLNTQASNNIPGCSLNTSTNQFTLPAGTYELAASAQVATSASVTTLYSKLRLWDVTDNGAVTSGINSFVGSATAVQQSTNNNMRIMWFQIAAPKAFAIQSWTSQAAIGGLAMNSGMPEEYVGVYIRKVG